MHVNQKAVIKRAVKSQKDLRAIKPNYVRKYLPRVLMLGKKRKIKHT